MSRKRHTGRSQYISRQRKQRVTSSPVLDMIAAAGFIIGFFAFIVGKSNEQMIFQYAGDIEVKAAVICFVIALIIILICSVCFRKRIPENQKMAFYIILQLFLFSWMYTVLSVIHLTAECFAENAEVL